VLRSKNIEDKTGYHHGRKNSSNVEHSAQALPTLALGIEKYLFIRHEGFY
jgi:hypothetical protein